MSWKLFLTSIGILILVAGGFVFFGTARHTLVAENPEISPSPTLPDRSITMLFVGDVMLSRTVASKIAAHGNDYLFPFRKVLDFLQEPDITFANLENPVSVRGRNVGSIYSFRADPAAVPALREAGFDVVSVANNHMWDWGKDALLDTVTLLREGDIEPVGAGKNYEEANAVKVLERNGMRLGLYAYTNLLPKTLQAGVDSPGLSEFDVEKIKARVQADKTEQRLDFSVVSLHWGTEYATSSDAAQKRIARELIDAGADIIAGHHPHVEQEVEAYNGGLIIYSLGNFVFDQYFSEETMQGLAVRVTLSDKGVVPEYFRTYLNREYQIEEIMNFEL
jgi:poly-gamma-glutamate capsule biosynthesis protein CapA/YwtB (metallophosphatase superfamily)